MTGLTEKTILRFNPKKNFSDILYHYTDPNGLLAIFKNGTLRFTDCEFVNDTTDTNHLIWVLKNVASEVSGELLDPDLANRVVEFIEEEYTHKALVIAENKPGNLKLKWQNSRNFVFCASEDPDSLNMWNYYTKGSNYEGYNIGFNMQQCMMMNAKNASKEYRFVYGTVFYEEDEQKNFLKSTIIKYDKEIHRILSSRTEKNEEEIDIAQQEIFGELLFRIERYRLFFKNEAFKHEEEYRIALMAPRNSTGLESAFFSRGFTTKRGIIVPHIDVALFGNAQATVSSVTIAPAKEFKIAKEGLRRFLDEQEYVDVKIETSKIPIRF